MSAWRFFPGLALGLLCFAAPASAILIETEESLEPTEAAARVEDPEYVRSWMS